MPAAAAVSTRPVPFGTCTERSSILTVTSSGVLNSDLSVDLVPGPVRGPGPWTCPGTRSRWNDGSRGHPLRDRGVMRVLVDRREQTLERRFAAEWAVALVHVRAELVAELDHV